MNENDLAAGNCLLDGKYQFIPSSNYNAQSSEGEGMYIQHKIKNKIECERFT